MRRYLCGGVGRCCGGLLCRSWCWRCGSSSARTMFTPVLVFVVIAFVVLRFFFVFTMTRCLVAARRNTTLAFRDLRRGRGGCAAVFVFLALVTIIIAIIRIGARCVLATVFGACKMTTRQLKSRLEGNQCVSKVYECACLRCRARRGCCDVCRN